MRIGRYEVYGIDTGRFALDGGAMFGVVPRPLWQRTNPPDERNRIGMAARALEGQAGDLGRERRQRARRDLGFRPRYDFAHVLGRLRSYVSLFKVIMGLFLLPRLVAWFGVRNVFLLYDSDGPGLKATFRSGDELLRQGFSVRVVTLPAGEDPDSFVRAHGAAALETELGNAIDVFERKIQILERAGWFGELQKKRRALDRLLPTIRATSDPIMRDLYLSRAAEVTGVDRAILLVEAGTPAAGPGRPVQRQQSAPRINPEIRTRPGDRRTRALMRGASAERELIRAMLTQRSRVDTIAERIGPDSFRDDRYRAIFSALLSAGDAATIDEIAPMLGAEEIEIVESLLEDPTALVNPDRTIDDSLAKLEVRDMEDRLADIDRLLPLARDEEKEMLDEERQKIVLQMRASGKMSFKAFRRGRAR